MSSPEDRKDIEIGSLAKMKPWVLRQSISSSVAGIARKLSIRKEKTRGNMKVLGQRQLTPMPSLSSPAGLVNGAQRHGGSSSSG